MLLLGACTNHFNFNAAVFGAAVFGLVVGNRLLLALAFGINTILFNALGHQIGLDGFGTLDRQLLVVSIGANRVSVADGDDHFKVDALDLQV